jgi:hypothetical protein
VHAIERELQAALDQPRAANEAQHLLVMDAPCDLAISASLDAIESLRLGWRELDRTPMTPNAGRAASACRASSRRQLRSASFPPAPANKRLIASAAARCAG